MDSTDSPGVYLFVHFNWPKGYTKKMAQAARALHDQVLSADWIQEVLAASGGIGGGPSSVWVFRVDDYAALDRLLKDLQDPVAQAYRDFFQDMVDVNESLREEVLFL